MHPRVLPLLIACLALPAGAQEPAALGYRMVGLDLTVFDGLMAEAEPLPLSRSYPPHNPPSAWLPPSSERDSFAAIEHGDGTRSGGGSLHTPIPSTPPALDFASLAGDSLDAEPEPGGVRPWRMAALTGGSTGAALFVMETQRRRWWEDRSPHFRVQNDWAYVRWADKLGHFYCGALLTRLYRGSLRWAGVSEGRSRLWGAVGGFTNMLYYEVLDGYGPEWGFSPGDLVFNTLGVFFAAAQADDPAYDAFFLKFAYWPSGWEGKNPIDDYAGQTYWLTANPHRLAPTGAKRVLPPWLNVAVGYGARDRDELDFLTTSLVYVGLDLEPAGLPFRGKVWDALVPVLRHVRFPGPAVRITPDPALVPFAY